MENKGFIAAPLLGTLIFLVVILFIVNLSVVEKQDVSSAMNGAYHNRMVSLLEVYRTDQASVFKVGMENAINVFILKPGWYKLSSFNSGSTEERGLKCDNISQNIRQEFCTFSTEQYAGLPGLMSVMNRSFYMEGISFQPVNPDAYGAFICQCGASQDPICEDFMSNVKDDSVRAACEGSGVAGAGYKKLCTTLLGKLGSSFDCNNFQNKPESPFVCKDYLEEGKRGSKGGTFSNPDGNRNGDFADKIPGSCSDGTFLVPIIIKGSALDDDEKMLFEVLPRVEADDGSGNTIRTGAFADRNFNIKINTRIYKYLDVACKTANDIYSGEANRFDAPIETSFNDPPCLSMNEVCVETKGDSSTSGTTSPTCADVPRRCIKTDWSKGADDFKKDYENAFWTNLCSDFPNFKYEKDKVTLGEDKISLKGVISDTESRSCSDALAGYNAEDGPPTYFPDGTQLPLRIEDNNTAYISNPLYPPQFSWYYVPKGQ